MSEFTLQEWVDTPVIPTHLEPELVEQLLEFVDALHSFCTAHDIQMVCLAQTQGDSVRHTLHGASSCYTVGKVPPELLMAQVLLTNGLASGLDIIGAIVDLTPERYSAPQLKLVKNDE